MFVLPSTQVFNFSDFGLLANGLNKIDDAKVSIYTAGQQRVTFDEEGNVGIGVTGTPFSHKLTMDGNINLSEGSSFKINGIDVLTATTLGTNVVNASISNIGDLDNLTVLNDIGVSGNSYLDTAIITGGCLYLTDTNEYICSDGTVMTLGVNGAERIRINNSGLVGIGTDNPLVRLHINGNTRIENFGSGDADLDLQSGRGDKWTIRAGTDKSGGSNPFRILNNSTNEYLTILEASGNIGIGITAPLSKLHVNGDLRVAGDFLLDGEVLTINSNIVTVVDPMIRLADNNPSDSMDIGFYGMYQDTGTTYFRGIIHDENAWKILMMKQRNLV